MNTGYTQPKGSIGCDETVWMKGPDGKEVPTHVVVDANIDDAGQVTLLSVKPFTTQGVGRPVLYDDCILSKLLSKQVDELKDAMKGHAED